MRQVLIVGELTNEKVLDVLTQRARARGEDVAHVWDRPRPTLATDQGNVVQMKRSTMENESYE